MVRPAAPRLLLAAAICAGAFAATTTPASAQWPFFMPRDPYPRDPYYRQRYRPPPPPSPFYGFPREPQRQIEAAPAPVAEEPSGTIYGSTEAADKNRTSQASHYVLVVGDSLADQLAQGLADAFVVERPEVAIVKKTRGSSGLVRADFYDWPAQLPGAARGGEAQCDRGPARHQRPAGAARRQGRVRNPLRSLARALRAPDRSFRERAEEEGRAGLPRRAAVDAHSAPVGRSAVHQ